LAQSLAASNLGGAMWKCVGCCDRDAAEGCTKQCCGKCCKQVVGPCAKHKVSENGGPFKSCADLLSKNAERKAEHEKRREEAEAQRKLRVCPECGEARHPLGPEGALECFSLKCVKQPDVAASPSLDVSGAEVADSNGSYAPTAYGELDDSYLGLAFGARSSRVTWQRRAGGGASYIILFANAAKTPTHTESQWELWHHLSGEGILLYCSLPSDEKSDLPPPTGWRAPRDTILKVADLPVSEGLRVEAAAK